MIKQIVFSVCSTLLLISAVHAQSAEKSQLPTESLVLTIDEAVNLANKNSRSLKVAQIDLEIKKRSSMYAWNVFIPSVTVSGTASRANEKSPSSYAMTNALSKAFNIPALAQPASYEEEEDRWSVLGNFNVALNLSLAQIQNIRAAHAEFESGEITWMQTVRQTEQSVRKLFYGLLLQQESFKVKEDSLENARKRAEQARVNYNNGRIPELSLLQAQVTYENQRPDIDKQRQDIEQALDNFSFILGLPVGTKITLVGEINPTYITLNAQDLYQQYCENNPEVQLIRKNIDHLSLQLSALNLKSYTPSLSLGWNSQPIVADVTKNWFDSDNKLYDAGSLSITIAWTLSDMLPFSANRLNAKTLQDNIRKLEIQLDTARQNTELTINKTVASLDQAKKTIESNQRNIKLAQRSYDMTAVSYRNGTSELLDLRDAENQLNQAKIGVLNAQYNYISYLLDLEYTLNTHFIGGSAK